MATMKLRTASQNLGWMDSVGPVTVAPGRPKQAVDATQEPRANTNDASRTREDRVEDQARRG